MLEKCITYSCKNHVIIDSMQTIFFLCKIKNKKKMMSFKASTERDYQVFI